MTTNNNTDYKQLSVGAIVAQDYATASVFKRLGIDFCCHGMVPLAQAVAQAGLNIDQVMRELQTASQEPTGHDFGTWPGDLVLDYVLKVHHRNFHSHHEELLALVRKVANAHCDHHPELHEVLQLVTASFDELGQHFRKEEVVLFPYLYQMWDARYNGAALPPFHCGSIMPPVRQMMTEHEDAGATWMRLSHITQDFTTPADGCASYRMMNEQLHRFFNDLLEHIHLENNIIFPTFLKMEQEF